MRASLRARLRGANLSAALTRVLFAPLTHIDAATVAAARVGVHETALCVWRPTTTTSTSPALQAFVLRVNVLATLAHAAQAAQRARERVDADDALDAFAYYVHAYLDAHLLAVVAVERGDADVGDFERAGGAYTALHEGSLPNLLPELERAAGLRASNAANATLAGALAQLLPSAPTVRKFVTYVERVVATTTPSANATLHALLAATLLGVYRHARVRPGFAARVHVYRVFFAGNMRDAVQRSFAHLTAKTRTGDKYENQSLLVALLREYTLHALTTRLPVVTALVRRRVLWDVYARALVATLDGARERLRPARILTSTPGFATSSAVRAAKPTDGRPASAFYADLVDVVESFCIGALDAVVTEPVLYVVRALVRACAEPTAIVATNELPSATRTLDALVADNRVPLRLVHASRSTLVALACVHEHYVNGAAKPVDALRNFVHLVMRSSAYEVLLVAAFARAVVERTSMTLVPLPAVLVAQQAVELRRRLRLGVNAPLPRGLLTTFVCRNCGDFCGELVPKRASVKYQPTLAGAHHIAFRPTSRETRARATLEREGARALAYETLVAAAGGREFGEYELAVAARLNRESCWPVDPALDDSAAALAAARAFLVDDDAPFELDDAAPVSPPTRRRRNGDGRALPVRNAGDDAYDTFVRTWHALSDVPFETTVPLAHPVPPDVHAPVVTCASKTYKSAHQKVTTRTSTAIDDALTDEERERVRANEAKAKGDYGRPYVHASRCRDTRATPVVLFGFALHLGERVIVACTGCLGHTTCADATWYGEALLCTRCVADRRRTGDAHVTTRRECRVCANARTTRAQRFYARHVYDETREAFVELVFCTSHAATRAWFFESPFLYTLDEFMRTDSSRAGRATNRAYWTGAEIGERRVT